MERITPQNFAAALVASFPALREDVESCNGLLYLQVGEFRVFSQEAIRCGEFNLVRGCFNFADAVFRNCDDEVSNAISVSYLESLDFTGQNGELAKAMLPPTLAQGWHDIMQYLDKIARMSGPGKMKASGKSKK